MSKVDELERMLAEAKREEAEKSGGAWLGYIFLFFMLIVFGRGCSGDKTNNVQEETPIEQESEPAQSDSRTTDNYPDEASHEATVEKHKASPEEKLESITGEKIDAQPETIDETAVNTVIELESSNN